VTIVSYKKCSLSNNMFVAAGAPVISYEKVCTSNADRQIIIKH
jgi:hypothetical protein